VPFDIGCTFRTGTRFGPQGMRRISALHLEYSDEQGVDLSESLAMGDVGDISCPADMTKVAPDCRRDRGDCRMARANEGRTLWPSRNLPHSASPG
jgi:arginase family enzyme